MNTRLPQKNVEREHPFYLLAQMSIPDLDTYLNQYVEPVTPLLEKAGARILVATANTEVLEGESSSNWTVLIEFPSEEAAREWYTSDEYVPHIKTRQAHSDPQRSTLSFAPAFQQFTKS